MTIDKRRRRPKPGQLPAFTPVPRLTQRHDGWTEERQHNFIAALADTGSVKAAAHRVNMTPEGAYLLRRHSEAASFRAAWEAALALGIQQLEDIAMERALYGQEVPVYSYGKLIGSRIVHNDRLLMFMLRNRAPTRFTADGRAASRQNTIGDPAHASQLSRLKKQWRKEWEEEQRKQAEASDRAVYDEIDDMLDTMQQRWLGGMTQRTLALYQAYEAAEAEDEAAGRSAHTEAEAGDKEDSEAEWEARALPPPGWTRRGGDSE